MSTVVVETIIEKLRIDLSGSRVTLRQKTDDEVFPITHETLSETTRSIIGVETPNMASQPVVLKVLAGEQVVQNDCTVEFVDDRPFHDMLKLYGGMQAQIVSPVAIDGTTKAIVSLHVLDETRRWSQADAARCQAAADEIRAVITSH